jgi:ABC-type nitrate/sulfonate/bicarbonate transport system permease component
MSQLTKITRRWEILPVVIFLGLWEMVARLNLVPGQFSFPPFSVVMEEFGYLIASGILVDNFFSSLFRVLIGFFIGSLAGISMGIIMGWNEATNRALHPIFSLLYPIPALGWLPILMLWFGIGELLPITIVFLCCFFPVLYNTLTGIKGVPRELIRAAEILGAPRTKVLRTIMFPLALPNIFTGLRLEVGMAWRVIIAAEMVAIPTGIGALLMRAESLIRVDIIIVCLIVLSVMCLSFERFFMFIEYRLTSKWK